MRAVIVDDETHIHQTLKRLISYFTVNLEIVGTAKGVKEGIELILDKKPDLLFLDIQMKDGTGFDLLRGLAEQPYTIFVTAHDEHAIRAFKFNALDYLVKPIDSEALQEAINRADELYKLGRLKAQYHSLLNDSKDQNSSKKIILRDAESVHVLDIHDILWCKAEGSYTQFNLTKQRQIIVSRHLKEYEDLLRPYDFYRVNRAFLINYKEIVRYDKVEGKLVLKSGDEVPTFVKRDQLREMLAKIY